MSRAVQQLTDEQLVAVHDRAQLSLRHALDYQLTHVAREQRRLIQATEREIRSRHRHATSPVTDPAAFVPWPAIGAFIAVVLVVAMLVLFAGVALDLLTEPAPPCTTDVIQGVCSGVPR